MLSDERVKKTVNEELMWRYERMTVFWRYSSALISVFNHSSCNARVKNTFSLKESEYTYIRSDFFHLDPGLIMNHEWVKIIITVVL